MNEFTLVEILTDLALLFATTYLLAGLLEKARIPGILASLLIAMVVHYTPMGTRLLGQDLSPTLSFLANLGVLFLLFYIGLQIDLREMRRLSRDIIWLTLLASILPFLLAVVIMLSLGFGWMLGLVIGLTRVPTAEAVIAPMLEEFRLLRTRAGEFILGAGVLDDVVEVILVALVSIWIGTKTDGPPQTTASQIGLVLGGLMALAAIAYLAYHWVVPWLSRWAPRKPRYIVMLSMLVLFAFGGLSQYAQIGTVVGAVIAGIVMSHTFGADDVGKEALGVIQAFSYGFIGMIFFYWVGLTADVTAMFKNPGLAIALTLATVVGKLLASFLIHFKGAYTAREAWVVGVGLSAQLTTEIVVAQLLLSAKLISLDLFTALVAASSLSTIAVPIVFTFFVRRWGDHLQAAGPVVSPHQ